MSEDKPDFQKQLREGLEELRTLRDEIRVKMHLAGMEAKERWKALEPRFEQIEGEVREATDSATEQLRGALDELRESFKKLRSKL